MKHIKILIFSLSFSLVTFSQNEEKENNFEPYFSVKFAVNTVDDNGDGNPFSTFNKFRDNAFSSPFALGLEYRFSRALSVELLGSINKFKPNGEDVINQNFVNKEVNYMSLDLSAKLYLDDIVPFMQNKKIDWYDLYLLGGVGYFNEDEGVNESAFAGVFGVGGNIWLVEKLAFNIEGRAKFSGTDTANHAQYLAGLQYNFGKRSRKNKPKEVEESIVEVVEENAAVDSDGDGVLDENDPCPSLKGDKSNNGCPWPDSDGDGVVDRFDECPDVKGDISNFGCPIKLLDVVNTDIKNNTSKNIIDLNDKLLEKSKLIRFDFNQTSPTVESLLHLNEILTILKDNAQLYEGVNINGHSDSIGASKYNSQLSQERANFVKDYLVAGGIVDSIISISAFGELKPVDTNLTKEGRDNNRRVEIFVKN